MRHPAGSIAGASGPGAEADREGPLDVVPHVHGLRPAGIGGQVGGDDVRRSPACAPAAATVARTSASRRSDRTVVRTR
jgi:hypothetical protein